MNQFFYNDNQDLACEGLAVGDLVVEHGTPLYVYSTRQIVDRCSELRSALEGLPSDIAYAMKANANEAILKILIREGMRVDVVSAGEMLLALRAGFAPSGITFAGVGKRDDEIECALEKNIFSLVVESAQELDVISSIALRRGVKAPVFIRVNPDVDAQTHPYISTGLRKNKFGINIDQAPKIFSYAASLPAIDVIGVHMHLGSQITKVEPYAHAVHSLVRLVTELRQAGIGLKYLDIGGGFGVQYIDALRHPLVPREESIGLGCESAPEVIAALKQVLTLHGLKIIVEPGRFLVAESGILVTKVLYTKETTEKKFVIVDAAMTDLIRPSLYHAYHQIVPLALDDSPAEIVDVVGPVCESTDFLAKDRLMKVVHPGDYIAVLTAGAYGYVLASNYNARLRPAEVLVDGTTSRLIRRRETFEDLVKGLT